MDNTSQLPRAAASVPPALGAFFAGHPRAALAFSGGVDSAYLLYAAVACGCAVTPYYVRSAFQPAFEYADAMKLAASLGVEPRVVSVDVLADPAVRANPADRCYHCKRAIFAAIAAAASADGHDVLLDGTNATDDAGDRPGMRALRELGVLSPLKLCGLGKPEIRGLSKAAGLFTWDKPAYACLATRIPTGTAIAPEDLRRIEAAEDALFRLGYSDFRARLFHGAARLQFPAGQLARAAAERGAIREALAPWFDIILLDTEDRG